MVEKTKKRYFIFKDIALRNLISDNTSGQRNQRNKRVVEESKRLIEMMLGSCRGDAMGK